MIVNSRRDALIDADAFNCFRSLGVLDVVRNRPGFRLLFTGVVARYELKDLQAAIEALVGSELAAIYDLPAGDSQFRRLRRAGVDRGEAEAIAWLLSQQPERRPIFVTNDRAARVRAESEGIEAADLLDFMVELLDRGLLFPEEASRLLVPWDDRRQQQCRPRDWLGYARTIAARSNQCARWRLTITGELGSE